jgi:hypothetical protein
MRGRVAFNPLVRIDPIGTVALALFLCRLGITILT